MRRCPKCNRTYSTDTQKFCTHDGGLLFTVQEELTETVQFDSSKVRDAVSKPTTRDLSEQQAAVDPEATVVSSGVNDGTQQVKTRDTGSLEPPPQTQYYGAPPSQPSTGPVAPPPVTPSGPIPPPPTSAPLPPAQAPSGPIPPPPQAQAAAAAAHPSKPLPPAAQKKKSKLPLILGLLAVVIVLFVGAAIVVGFFVWRNQRPEAVAIERPTTTEPVSDAPNTATPSQASIPSNEPPPYNPPADAVQFVNAQDVLSGRLALHFVDFAFYYPNRWEKDPKSGIGESQNFIEVHRQLPPNFTQESMAVSWYESKGSMEADQNSFPSFVEQKSSEFAQNITQYRKVSEGPTKIGSYDGYEFRFEGVSQNTERGQFKIWGRVIWLPPPSGGSTGVTLLMLTTSLAPELESIDDVGVKGELPMVLESFRFGK